MPMKNRRGIALILETTPAFYQTEWDDTESKASFKFLSKYLLKYKNLILQLAVGLLAEFTFLFSHSLHRVLSMSEYKIRILILFILFY
jgi:hypothetical protein